MIHPTIHTLIGLGTAATQDSSAFEVAGTVAAAAAAADRQFATRGNTTALRLAGTSKSFDVCISTLQINDNGVLDDVVFVGLNYLGPTGRQDATQASIHDGWENCYKQYPAATYNQSERYVQYVLPDGTNGRTWMCEVRHTGPAYTRVNNSFWGNQAFRSVGDDSLTGYYSDGGVLTLYARIDFPTNNAPVLRQHKAAAGDNWVSLVYLDATDTTQVGDGGPVATGWTRTSAAGFDLQYDYAVRVKSSDGKSATEAVRLRHDTGRLTFGQSGQSMDVAGRTYFTHTPSYNGDSPLTVATTMTGTGSNYYGQKIGVTFSGANAGSVHYLSELAGNCTSTANSPTVTGQRVVITANGASAYLPDVTGFEYQGGTSAGFIGTQTGLKIKSPTATGGGFHSTTFYGVQVEDVTGPTNPYSIYTGAGWVRLGDGTAGSRFGAFGATPVVRPVLSYDRSDAGETAAVAAIRTALAALGWVDDQTTA